MDSFLTRDYLIELVSALSVLPCIFNRFSGEIVYQNLWISFCEIVMTPARKQYYASERRTRILQSWSVEKPDPRLRRPGFRCLLPWRTSSLAYDGNFFLEDKGTDLWRYWYSENCHIYRYMISSSKFPQGCIMETSIKKWLYQCNGPSWLSGKPLAYPFRLHVTSWDSCYYFASTRHTLDDLPLEEYRRSMILYFVGRCIRSHHQHEDLRWKAMTIGTRSEMMKKINEI